MAGITIPGYYAPVQGVPLSQTQGSSTSVQGGGAYPSNVSGVPLKQTSLAVATMPNNNLGTSTANPFNLADPNPPGGDAGNTGSLNYNNDQAAADAAAAQAAAEQAAKVEAARSAIGALSNSILGVYNSLYPQIDKAAGDQGRLVNQRYDTEVGGLTDQFNSDFPKIGNSYSARGAFDSSYRQDAEAGAQKAFGNQLDVEAQGRRGDLAKVGQFVASNKAKIGSNIDDINAILDHVGQTTDVNELSQIQAAIQQRLSQAKASVADLGTQGGYIGQLQGIVPTADQTKALTANLSTILQGAANPMLKRSIGQKLIASSGLPPDQQQQLLSDYEAQLGLGATEQQPVAA